MIGCKKLFDNSTVKKFENIEGDICPLVKQEINERAELQNISKEKLAFEVVDREKNILEQLLKRVSTCQTKYSEEELKLENVDDSPSIVVDITINNHEEERELTPDQDLEDLNQCRDLVDKAVKYNYQKKIEDLTKECPAEQNISPIVDDSEFKEEDFVASIEDLSLIHI